MAEKVRILVVDDEETLQEVFSRMLSSRGYSVDIASTAHEALEKIKSTKYQVCLLDVTLPDMRGTELLRLVHQMDPSMKKIMVTGDWVPHDVALAKKNGAEEFILKPLSRDDLVSAVESVLNAS